MAGAKSRSAHHKALCKAYKASNRREENKRKKIAKHFKANPNDKVAEKALAKNDFSPKKAPKKSHWSHTSKRLAKLMGEAGYKGFYHVWHADMFTLVDQNRGTFGKNACEVISAKWRQFSKPSTANSNKVSFRIGDRAHMSTRQ